MKDVEIVREDFDAELKGEVYLPFTIKSKCPNGCGDIKKSLWHSYQYMYHPKLGRQERVWINCEKCDMDVEVNVILDVTLTLCGENDEEV